MIVQILILIGLTIAAIAYGAVPRRRETRLQFSDAPDHPKPFGYGMSWLAIETTDATAVLVAMGLTDTKPANWNSGIGTVYDDALSDSYVFVSPPVRGWTFVVGVPLPHPFGHNFTDKLTPLLTGLAQHFPDVQYFATFPIIDFYGWARLQEGRLIRAFAIGDDGIVWDHGRLTPEEKALGLKLFDLRGIQGRKGDAGGAIILHPTEDQVLRMARDWSVDPLSIGADGATSGTGFVARAPASWRTERLRRAA